MTIDELAQRSNTAASTIRLYQSKALLQAPTKQGRVGLYGPDHLARLHLIAQLQGDGFSLAGIGQLLRAWTEGRALDEVLGLEARVAKTWSNEEPLVLTVQELADHFPGSVLPGEVAQQALSLGLVRIEGDHVVIDDRKFLEVGSKLAEMGIPLSEVIDEFEILKAAMAPIADRFTDLFRRYLWSSFIDNGGQQGVLPDLIANLTLLSQLAGVIVSSTLSSELKKSAENFLLEESGSIHDKGLDEVLSPLVKAAGLDFQF